MVSFPPESSRLPSSAESAPLEDSSRSTSSAGIAEVAVNAPLDRLFHYSIPGELAPRLRRGHRVLIPFGRREVTGVCVGFPERSRVESLKPILDILLPDCRFDAHLLELTRWIARYYQASWGEVLEAALPPAIRSPRRRRVERLVRAVVPAEGLAAAAADLTSRAPNQARVLRHLVREPGPHRLAELRRRLKVSGDSVARLRERGLLEIVEVVDDPARTALEAVAGPAPAVAAAEVELHTDQERALSIFLEALAPADENVNEAPRPLLVHGVTGSGKTEVYLRALRHVISRGGRGLVLVPEISLTPQTVRRFRDSLPGVTIAVLHSMLNPRERARQWREIQAGNVGVVIGARSAIFSPVPDLKLLVVDEEHEPSYKQESSPRYNARDVAILRARLLRIPVILGSATPSLESYHNARQGKYRLVEMPRRATRHDLPTVSVIELGPEFYRPDGSGLISGPLDYQLRQCLRRHEQAILFLNRRGFSTFLHCLQCGLVLRCEHCDIALTFHRREQALRCHYCDSRYPVPPDCPDCRFSGLRRSGVGTEKIAEIVASRYEGARVGRLDRDTIKSHSVLRTTLEEFARGEIDILVGTQMIAKGHDFPGVSLVGIISADTGLHFPDFRSAERTFQIITQVSGRAGRGDRPGRVVVQTFFPDHYAIRLAVKSDYCGLYDAELAHREDLGYPPFGRVAKILVQDARESRGRESAEAIAALLEAQSEGLEGVEILGPAPAPITRIQERHRFQILLKSPEAGQLQRLLRSVAARRGGRTTAEIIVDVDPQTML